MIMRIRTYVLIANNNKYKIIYYEIYDKIFKHNKVDAISEG